jgi:PAS domain S-box-containing protein
MVKNLQSTVSETGLMRSEIGNLLDQIPAALAFASGDGKLKILHVNPEFTRLFGYAKEDVRTVSQLTELTKADAVSSGLRSASSQAAVEASEGASYPSGHQHCHVLCKDGTYRDVNIRISRFRNQLLFAFAVNNEKNNEKKSLENSRLTEEQQFRIFVENANDIVYTLDPQGRFTYMSPSTKTLLGLDPADLLHTHFGDLLHPDDLPARLTDFAKIVEHGERLNGIEYRVLKGDGSWGWQSSNLGPILDDAGRISAVVGVGRDI